MDRRRRRGYLAAVILAAVVVATRFSRSDSPSLLQHATKLAEVQSAYSYSWLSDTDLLVRTDTPGTAGPQGPWSGYFEMVDLRTGKRTRLEGLTAAVLHHAGHYNARYGPRSFRRSPDGEWLLWDCIGPATGHNKIVTARLDGSSYHEWNSQSNATWLDSDHWASTIYTQPLTSVGKDGPQYRRVVYNAAQPDVQQNLSAASSQTLAQEFRSQQHSPDAVLYAIAHGRDGKIMYDVMRRPEGWPRDQGVVLWDSLTLKTNGVWSSQADLTQRRLVMLFHEDGVPIWERVNHSVFSTFTYHSHPVGRMYLYHADRKELKEIGHLEETSSDGQEFARPNWMPDGQHIQFFYKGALYSAKID